MSERRGLEEEKKRGFRQEPWANCWQRTIGKTFHEGQTLFLSVGLL